MNDPTKMDYSNFINWATGHTLLKLGAGNSLKDIITSVLDHSLRNETFGTIKLKTDINQLRKELDKHGQSINDQKNNLHRILQAEWSGPNSTCPICHAPQNDGHDQGCPFHKDWKPTEKPTDDIQAQWSNIKHTNKDKTEWAKTNTPKDE